MMTQGHENTTNPSLLDTFSTVQTIYILSNGDRVTSMTDLDAVKDRFSWLDKKTLLTELLHTRGLTNTGNQSIIAVYEEGKKMKTFLNLPYDFHPSDL
jgi:hypothetical protein